MRWLEASRLIARIRRERPELSVDFHASPGAAGHFYLRLYAIVKDESGGRTLAPGSVDTIHGPDGWKRYKERHPEPWCRPEDSYHTDALGREVNHRGEPLLPEPPAAPPVSAEAMLERLIALNRSDPGWWKDPAQLAEMAAAWGARIRGDGTITDYHSEEVARIAGDCHASILIARTGSGLYATGVAAQWGDGGTILEPSVGSVPYGDEIDARRAAYRELIETLQAGRGAARHQQRQLLIARVREKDRQRGLFA